VACGRFEPATFRLQGI